MAEDRSILIKTAYAYYQRGDWDRALEEYHKLVDLDPGDLNVLNILADIYAKKGDVKEALRQYDLVAQGYDQKNQVDKVLQVYKRMIKLSPANLDLQSAVKNLVQKYLDRAAQLEESDPDRVLEIYRSILKAEPNRFDATVRMSKVLLKRQQKFQAVELLLNMAEALDPATQSGRLLESLQLVVEIDPVNVEARDKLSKFLIASKETSLAIENLRALMEIYISRNDLERARDTAQRAIDLGDVEAYYHLGVIHFNQERFGESLQCFRRFLQKQETHVGALKYLALCHLKLNQHGEAVQAYLRILSVYVNENLIDEAKEVRQTILELDPANEAVKAITLDRGQEAVASSPEEGAPVPVASAALTVTTEQEQQAFLEHAQEFVEKGLYDQAIDLYLEMIKRWPSWNEIKVRLQQVYALMVKPAEPTVKPPSSEEMKAELERELREQMKNELELQTRRMAEDQAKMQAERLKEIERIKQEQEEERKRLQKELEDKMLEQMRKTREEEQQRDQLRKEFEERQKSLSQEWEKFEREKQASVEGLRQEMEKAQRELEERLRLQVEKELREKLERETQEREAREREQRERDEKVKALMLQQEEERQRYEAEKAQQLEEDKKRQKADASLQDEILKRMERLRGEKEKEPVLPPPVMAAPEPPPEPVAPSSQMQEVEKPLGAAAASGPELALNDPFVRQTLADIYAKQGLFVEAVKIYEKILNEDPNNDEVREKLREILRLKGF